MFTAATPAHVRRRRLAVPEPTEGSFSSVYQLRIVLRGISPLIWRRLLMPATDSIADLHAALQIAFAWDGSHLHRFVIHGRESGHDSFLDPREVRLRELGLRVGERFRYEYDFTDYWLHDIRLEAIHEARPGRRYPVLTGGRRSAPPDGCGDAWAFLQLRQQHQGAPIKLLRMFGELLDAEPELRVDEILGDRYGEFLELLPVDADRPVRPPRRQPPTTRPDRRGEERTMRITVQVVIENDGQNRPEVHEVARLDRGELDAGTVGLQLNEAKQVLASTQEVVVAEQVRACLDARVPCPDCWNAPGLTETALVGALILSNLCE
jgi:hypothetical protein